MKLSVVVPTYISRDTKTGWKEGDAVYDHPTPLDKEGTLKRFLKSLSILENQIFDLVIIISTTTPDINKAALDKVYRDVKECNLPMTVLLITEDILEKILDLTKGVEDWKNHLTEDCLSLLDIRGYPNVRNLCLYFPYMMGSDVAVLLDDDEVIEDAKFLNKAVEFIGKRFHGKTIDAVAGYYLNAQNTYYDDITRVPWMTYWDRFGNKTEAFDQIIGTEPRIKETPFAFGGLMVLHRNLFRVVPFDPKITRGEDIDYLLNAKMFGFNFFLDNQLSIKHLPPKKSHPIWKRLREDITRFLYEKAKIDSQYDVPNLTRVEARDLFPYPGHFLDDTIEDKIFNSNVMLAFHYLTQGDSEASHEAMHNIFLSKENKPDFDVFSYLLRLQNNWKSLLRFSSAYLKTQVGMLLDECKLELVAPADTGPEFVSLAMPKKIEVLEKIGLFAGLDRGTLESLANISHYSNMKTDGVVFQEGSETDGLFVVISGAVSLVSYEENKEQEVALIKDLESIGEMALVTRGKHSVRAITKTPTEILHIGRADFERLLVHNLALASKIYRNIAMVTAERLRTANRHLRFKSTEDISAQIYE